MKLYKIIGSYDIDGTIYDAVKHIFDPPNYKVKEDTDCFRCIFNTHPDYHSCNYRPPNTPCLKYQADYFIAHHDNLLQK